MGAKVDETTRGRVLRAARRLIGEVGVDALTMRAVAIAAKITAGAIYRHFPSKEALVACVVNEAFEKLQAGVWRALARHPPGSFERIAELGRIYMEFSRKHPADYRVLFMPTVTPRCAIENSVGFQAVKVLEECVQDCIHAGVFAKGDSRMIALLLWSRLHGLISLFLSFDFSSEYPDLDRNHGLEQAAAITQPFILNGLRRD